MDGFANGITGLRRRLRSAPSLLLAAALLVSGCGYTSQYTPPRDGRARVVWKDEDVGVNLDGISVTPQCRAEIEAMFAAPRRVQPQYAGGTYWAPRYYGPNIVVIHPGLAPIFPRPPLFSPSLALARAVTSGGVRVGAPSPGVGTISTGSGGGGDSGKALAVLLVIVIVVLGVIDVLVSTIPPESSSVASREIDFTNAFNDLARTPGSACAYPDPSMGYPMGGQP